MAISREELVKKGWTEEEIDYTFNVIDTAKDKKSAFIHFLDGIISWVGLLLVFIGTLILSVVIMPFFITIEGYFIYLLVFLLAFVLGIVFNFLIEQINQMGKDEKIIGELLLPIISLIDVYVMFGISNVLIETLKINYTIQNKFLFATVFVVSLSLPFYITHWKKIINKYLNILKKNNFIKNIHVENSKNNVPNLEYGTENKDYYQAYLEDEKKKEIKKLLYQKKLKERLLKRLDK